jgi:lipoprotein signal peptidase
MQVSSDQWPLDPAATILPECSRQAPRDSFLGAELQLRPPATSLVVRCLALILGGAVGNLWDRVIAGHVVDFMDFYFGTYHWPAFNVADSGIIIGALMLVAEIIATKPPAEELERL